MPRALKYRKRKHVKRRFNRLNRRRVYRRRGIPRTLPLSKANVARVVERLPLDETNLTNTPYWYTFQLSSYPRANAVAQNFRFYRLSSVKITFQALSAIGMGNASGLTNLPLWLYFQVERQGFMPTTANLDYFLANGCKPRPFGGSTNKPVVIKYKPNLLNTIAEAEGGVNEVQASQPIFNRWISTHIQSGGGAPSDVLNNIIEWQGHSYYIDAPGTTPSAASYAQFMVEAVWEFKDPYIEEETEGALAFVKK